MRFYFTLQFRRLIRWFEETKINPLLGLGLAVAVFGFASVYLFSKIDYAEWIYFLISMAVVLSAGNSERTNHSKRIFRSIDFLLIRLIENGVVAIPFLVILIYEREFNIALGLVLASVVLAVLNYKYTLNWVIPTPFKKLPFELIIGFRKSFWFIGFTYIMCLKAIEADNFNFGVVSLAFVFLTCMSFYLYPENKFYVWIFSDDSKRFLRRKLLTIFIGGTILTIPVFAALVYAFPHFIPITIGVYIVGYIFLLSILVAKYSAYPMEMGIPQGIFYAIGLWLPPLLLVIIPIFYFQSMRKLREILG